METPTAGLAPVPAPVAEPKVVNPEPAQPAPSSLPAAKDPIFEAANSAKNITELRAATQRLLSAVEPKPPLNQPIPAEEPEAGRNPTPETPPAQETPAPEEATAAEPETPATPAAEETGDEPEGEISGEITPISADRVRLRVSSNDEVGKLAAAYLKRNQDMTWEQATDAARTKLGLNKSNATDPAVPAAPVVTGPQTVAEVDSKIAELETQKRAALDEVRLTDFAEIDTQLRKLDIKRRDLERNEAQQAVMQEQNYHRDFAGSEDRAIATFEFANKPGTPGHNAMLEIERDLEATQDPRLNSPNKPFLLAQMAAVRLNIAPKPKTPAAPPAPAAAPVVPSPKKQQLPAGGSRTVPAVSQPNGDVDRISQIQTPQQLKAELKRLGIAQ